MKIPSHPVRISPRRGVSLGRTQHLGDRGDYRPETRGGVSRRAPACDKSEHTVLESSKGSPISGGWTALTSHSLLPGSSGSGRYDRISTL